MVEIITDMLIANGAENVKNLQEKRKVNYFPLVFEKYHIDSTQFKSSNYYYTTRIDDYDAILKEVDIRLNKLKKMYEKERKDRDSLKRAERENLKIFKNLIDMDGNMMIDSYYNVHIPFLRNNRSQQYYKNRAVRADSIKKQRIK